MASSRVLAAAALALLLSGCGLTGGSTPSLGDAASSLPLDGGSPSTDAAAPPAPGVATPSPTDSDDAPPELVLQGDGLGLLQDDADVDPLPFGTPAAALTAALEGSLGPTTTTPLPDCPQGPRTAVEVDGFRALLDGDQFVGWTDHGAADRSLTTADGIGTGSRLDDLQSALPDAQVVPTAQGATWSSPGGLSGTVDRTDPDGHVTSLSGGQTCDR